MPWKHYFDGKRTCEVAKRKTASNTWDDHYSRKAKKDNYPARSVYKLKEIQQKFTILKKNDKVLDLGCAPGSWLLFAGETVGAGGEVIGIDLKSIEVRVPSWVTVITGDILELADRYDETIGIGYQVVLSDMAPQTTGRKDLDAYRSYELCETALNVATHILEKNGHFVCKIFQGNEFQRFSKQVQAQFRQMKIFKPDSCRKASKEIYIIGIGKK